MSEFADRIAKLSPKRLALLALELQERLDDRERRDHDPIAVIGLGCRLPGKAHGAHAFWELLRNGVDAVSEVPADRWDVDAFFDPSADAPGKMVSRWGGFIDGVDEFDASLFNIAPREAVSLDPQQRLLLETSWEALEDAGQAPDRLHESPTGVFVGIGTSDYAQLLSQSRDFARIDAYRATGCISRSPASGRIAYVLGLQGPAISIDTACSSSLVALHLACQALRADECRMALAGGVNAILSPEIGVSLSKAGMMAPDGRCKTFDAAADGFVRGEGCGMLVLKRLSDALADGDRVLAVIRASAVNQDGRSNGLTAPNGPAQEAVIRDAVARSGLAPEDISYVETHGTGTALGDPIEVQALGETLCRGRSHDNPLWIGSVKTNVGHLEATAGVASVIKVILALQHRTIPGNLHFQNPSPYIPWDRYPLRVPTSSIAWDAPGGRRIAGVSSFGFSGTNAHVIVEEAPAVAAGEEQAGVEVVTVSAKSEAALRAVAARLAPVVRAAGDAGLAAVSGTANTGRAQWAHRAAVVGATAADVATELDAIAAGNAPVRGARGIARGAERVRVAWLFTGQGAQYPGMGHELYAREPAFRAALDACAAGLREALPVPLLDVLYGGAGARLEETAYAQPALFAVEYALAAQWRAWGVQPAVVLGHSVGEYAAACVAGVLPLDAALRLIAARGQLMQALPGGGAMAAVLAPADTVTAWLVPGVTVAAVNGSAAVVVAGPVAGVTAVCATAEAAGCATQPLAVSHAFHTAAMDPMLEAWGAVTASVRYGTAQVPVVSSVTGALAGAELGTAGYWRRQVRAPVQFAAALESVLATGCEAVLEVGPHPTLIALGRRRGAAGSPLWGASLERGHEDARVMRTTLAALWTRGATVDWAGVHAATPRRVVALPTYPFERTRFWIDTPMPQLAAASSPAIAAQAESPSNDDIFYGIEWVNAPGRPSTIRHPNAPMPAAHEVSATLRPVRSALAETHGLRVYETIEPDLDRLCTAYVYRALQRLGWQPRPGDRWSSGDLVQQLGIVRTHRRLVDRLLDMLREDGVLARRGSVWTVLEHQPPNDPDALQRTLELSFAPCRAELLLLGRCGGALDDVLRGAVDPLHLLFPNGAADDLEAVYGQSPAARVHNALIAAAVAGEAERYRHEGADRLRVLEIGGGTGATTSSLLPVLPEAGTHYRFTDVSTFFVGAAARRFARPAFQAQVLDIERDPQTQGFAGEQFDIVIAANVLHATRDLGEAVDHVSSLLAPGGLLLLWEHTRAERWVDLVFGLTDGWWRFTDTGLRPEHPLITGGQWRELLAEHGVPGAAVIVDERAGAMSPHALICARRPLEVEAPANASEKSEWLILADRTGLARELTTALDARHCSYRVVDSAAPIAVESHAGPIVDLRALDIPAPHAGTSSDVEQAQVDLGRGLLALVRASSNSGDARRRVWLVTRGAQPVDAGDPSPNGSRGQAPLWGWGRVLRLEHPEMWGGLIDLDPSSRHDEASRMVDEILNTSDDDQVAFRDGVRYAARLTPLRPARDGRPAAASADGTYLVTGGLGAVGLHAAGWLADWGARHLVLVGRSGIGRGRQEESASTVLRALERRGITVQVIAADVGDEAQMAAVFATVDATGFPLRGVVHAAGVLTAEAILKIDDAALSDVLHPKVAGAEVLHRLTAALPLDFFLLFSTSASLIGSKGLSHYVAANAFLDALAHDRRSQGLPALAIDWGRWDVVSRMMSDRGHRWLDAEGMRALSPRRALDAMERLLASSIPQAAVLAVDPLFFRRMAAEVRGGFLSRVTSAAVAAPPSGPAVPTRAASGTRAAPESATGIDAYLHRLIAGVIGLPLDELDVDVPINTLGMDSIMALQLKNRIEADLHVTVSVVHFLSGDSVAQLAVRLSQSSRETATARRPSLEPAVSLVASPAEGPDPDNLSDAEVDAMLARLLSGETPL